MKMQTSIRVEKEFYEEARKVFEKFGLSFADAVNIFLSKVAMEKGFPFELKLPSKEVEKRAKNIERNENVKIYKNSKELFEDLGI